MEEAKSISSDQKLTSISVRRKWLIAQNLESHNQTFYSIDSPHLQYDCQLNELHGRRIRASFHGWVILSNHPDNVLWSLYNPLITSKLIRLPHLFHKEKNSLECCLSAPPDDQGSIFMLTTPKVPTIVFCRLDCKRKRLKWTEMSYAKQLWDISGVDDCFLQSPTCCNGKVYAMILGPYYNYVIHVDIAVRGKEVVISLLPFVEITNTFYNRWPSHNSFHTVCCFLKGTIHEIFYIEVLFKDKTKKNVGEVYLFKLDMTSMIWEEMVDIEDAMFFIYVDGDYSTCYYDSSDFAFNSPFNRCVHIICDSGKIIYSFHVKDITMSINLLETKAYAWAMLEWRLETGHAKFKQEVDTISRFKGENIDFDSTTGESYLLNIPIHILSTIMEFCIGREYVRFRATCKHFYLATPSVPWSNERTLKRLQMYPLDPPWLVVLDNRRGIITLIHPISDDRYYIRKPQELKGDYQISCSRYGWLLMYQIPGPIVFFNPFTSNIRELPEAPASLKSLCFSAPPTSPKCMVVGFTTSIQCHVFIHCVSQESTWRKFHINFGGDDPGPYSFSLATFSGQDVYALCNNIEIVAFRDMNKDRNHWKGVVDKAPISGCRSPAQYFLSTFYEHLLLVIVGEFGESVEMFTANEITEEWEKLTYLGNQTIYLSDTSCIRLETIDPEMGNKLYFPRFCAFDGTTRIFYSLYTKRYNTFRDDLLGTKQYCCPHAWIEPSWSSF